MTVIQMPIVGYDIKTGQIVEWCKKVGEKVEKGEVVVIVESEKSTFDVEAEAAGVLLATTREIGEEIAVLTTIGFIGQPGERLPEGGANAGAGVTSRRAAPDPAAVAGGDGLTTSAGVPLPVTQQTPPNGAQPHSRGLFESAEEKVFASPVARRVARQLATDLHGIRGSGPGGRIIKRDVLKVGGSAAPGSEGVAADTIVAFSAMRKAIAERLVHSKQTIPHFYLFADVAMESVLALRETYNLRHQTRVTITDLVIAAVARSLRRFPRLNSHVMTDRMVVKSSINIGVATSVEDGLLVPVIPGVDKLSLADLSASVKKATAAARHGRSINADPGSFTVSSLGMYGTSRFLPIINPPHAAILGVGAVEKRVVAEGAYIGVRSMMTVSLACDHRAIDGTYAAEFLSSLERNLLEAVSEQ